MIERYMLRLVDQDLIDFVQSLSWGCTNRVGKVVGEEHLNAELNVAIFEAIVEYLKPCLHAYAACGVAPGCDDKLQDTTLAPPGGPRRHEEIPGRSDRINRYDLELHISLDDFVRRLEGAILREIGRRIPGTSWRKRLFQDLRDCVEPLLGRYLFAKERCGYMCDVVAITEYDPWRAVTPATGS